MTGRATVIRVAGTWQGIVVEAMRGEEPVRRIVLDLNEWRELVAWIDENRLDQESTQERAEQIIRELQPLADDGQIRALAGQLRRLLTEAKEATR